MAMVVLVLLGAAALGAGAGAVRRRLIARRTAAAHHRALDTMGRLVAQNSGPGAPSLDPVDPNHPHVRLVRTESQRVPTPPALRSQPKRGRASAYQRAGRGFDAPHATAAEPAPPVAAPPPEASGTDSERSAPAAPTPAPTPAPTQPIAPDPIAPDPIAPDPVGPPPAASGQPEPARPRHLVRRRHLVRPVSRPRRLARSRPTVGRGGNRRPTVVPVRLAVVAAVVVVVAGVAAGFLLTGKPGHSSPPARPSPVAQPGPTAKGPTSKPAVHATAPAPPVHSDVSLVASSAGYSMYRLSWPATITVNASGPCWVEIRDTGPTGPVTYEGDLSAGASQAVTGPVWLRLGNPTAVAVAVDGQAITPPLVAGEPYNIQFE